MRDDPEIAPYHLLSAKSENVAKLLIDPEEAAIEADVRHADCRLLEIDAEPVLAFACCLLGVFVGSEFCRDAR